MVPTVAFGYLARTAALMAASLVLSVMTVSPSGRPRAGELVAAGVGVGVAALAVMLPASTPPATIPEVTSAVTAPTLRMLRVDMWVVLSWALSGALRPRLSGPVRGSDASLCRCCPATANRLRHRWPVVLRSCQRAHSGAEATPHLRAAR